MLELEKLSSIEHRGQTDRVTALPRPYILDINLTLTYNRDFQSQTSYGHDPHWHTYKNSKSLKVSWFKQ